MIDYFALIQKYFPPDSESYRIFIPHACMVTAKALAAAWRLGLSADQMAFIEEAAMLHDIGIVRVSAPELGCRGTLPYICHGVEGRHILEAEGLPHHALVSERHTGVGITRLEIEKNGFPIPARDMLAVSLEEKIISWADLFFGKGDIWREKPAAAVRDRLARYDFGGEKVQIFDEWQGLFGENGRSR